MDSNYCFGEPEYMERGLDWIQRSIRREKLSYCLNCRSSTTMLVRQ
jgi:hypothetical protein